MMHGVTNTKKYKDWDQGFMEAATLQNSFHEFSFSFLIPA